MASRHLKLGRDGEDRAARWYCLHGFEILARNWRVRAGQIDLIVSRGALVVIVEVKTRWCSAQEQPAAAVTPVRQRHLRTLATAYLADPTRTRTDRFDQVRFDVVAITGSAFEVIEDAF